MNRLIAEIQKQMKTVVNAGYWHADWSASHAVADTLTEEEANDFMLAILPKLTDEKTAEEWGSAVNRFVTEHGTALFPLVSAETLQDFVDGVLDNSDYTYPNYALPMLSKFPNLQLDTLQQIFNYEPVIKKDSDGDEDYSEARRKRIDHNVKEALCESACVTEEWLDSMAGERGEGFLHVIANRTKNPSTLLKLAFVYARQESRDYYTAEAIVSNDIMTVEMLEEIAGISDGLANTVLGCRKCTKALLAKISLTAKGAAARTILSNGKTEPAILEALVDSNNEADVLVGIAQNRSKKVPVTAILKAFAKIPDNNYWVKQKFIKRADLGKALADLARKATGAVPVADPADNG